MAGRVLDDVDRRLLGLLEKDARRPVVALAKAVGLSRSAVQERLARLEDQGTISRYTIVRGDQDKAAVTGILLVRIAVRPCEPVLRKLRDWPEIRACWSVAGPTIDAVIVASVSDNAALGDFRERLAALDGVDDIITAPVLRTVVERNPN
ncbi:Lrp/AsnC family transcriptional regulator [Sphingomonas xanthus]|nr:Lrp/AsnC family transcriptional regulator [Sphingomonas xanthus]